MASSKISNIGNIYRFDYNSSTFQQPLVKWKGKTFNQVFASLQKNTHSFDKLDMETLRHPLPLKHYRKEIASNSAEINKSQRISLKIDYINTPNGQHITTSIPNENELTTTLDINYVNNSTEHPETCKSFNGVPCMVTESNARNRVRSAGMYSKKKDIYNNNNAPIYHSSARSYLLSRSKTFEQNQYNFFRNGNNKNDKPGQTQQTYFNDYSAQGIQHCSTNEDDLSTVTLANTPHRLVSYKPNNWKFARQGAVNSSELISSKKDECYTLCINQNKKFPHVQTKINSCGKNTF